LAQYGGKSLNLTSIVLIEMLPAPAMFLLEDSPVQCVPLAPRGRARAASRGWFPAC